MIAPVPVQMFVLLLLLLFLLGSVSGHGQVQQQLSTTKTDSSSSWREGWHRMDETILVTERGGVLQSPEFPRKYPRMVFLSWNLLSPPGTHILLEFDHRFKLEDSAENGGCWYDFVVVEESTETSSITWGPWCGKNVPPTINSTSNQLRVTFNSDEYFSYSPGFKVYYSLLYKSPPPPFKNYWDYDALMDDGVGAEAGAAAGAPAAAATIAGPLSMDDLDQTISAFNTVEQLFRTLNPNTWRLDLDTVFDQKHILYRSRKYFMANRLNKAPDPVDLNRLNDDVKRYSCTPHNHSVNLREELRTTNAVFFPRCLLVKRCGGNCGCATDRWNSGCVCQASGPTLLELKVLKYTPETNLNQRNTRTRLRWVLSKVSLTHHEKCECACSRPPR